MAVDIVSACVSNNVVPASGVPALIASVHETVAGLGRPSATGADGPATATPAQIEKSISRDTLISFEDSKPYKTLRRHLSLRGLSPEAYRAEHGLPSESPMTSAAYSAQRSELARTLGLGQQRRKSYARADAPTEVVAEKPKRAGRARKVAEIAEG